MHTLSLAQVVEVPLTKAGRDLGQLELCIKVCSRYSSLHLSPCHFVAHPQLVRRCLLCCAAPACFGDVLQPVPHGPPLPLPWPAAHGHAGSALMLRGWLPWMAQLAQPDPGTESE